MVRTHLLFLFFFFLLSPSLLFPCSLFFFLWFLSSIPSVLYVFFSYSLFFLHLCSIPSLAFYSQRMHVFSLIIKTFRIVIAGVMVTIGDGRGVCFFLLLYSRINAIRFSNVLHRGQPRLIVSSSSYWNGFPGVMKKVMNSVLWNGAVLRCEMAIFSLVTQVLKFYSQILG